LTFQGEIEKVAVASEHVDLRELALFAGANARVFVEGCGR
jgi:hypothetical protein